MTNILKLDYVSTMKTIHDIQQMQQLCSKMRKQGKTIGFVPTMGALHEGHLRLVDEAKKRCDWVVVSIFVNPTQFGPNEDFDKYPRDLDADAAQLSPRGTDAIFAPGAAQMYPPQNQTTVSVATLTSGLCGSHRPNHFDGVALVVTKLFNIIGECTAVFGKKDYQQLQVIRQFTKDLNMPITIIGLPTVRESDGLAMSSRNAYLSPAERKRALMINASLQHAHKLFSSNVPLEIIKKTVTETLVQATDSIDYVAVVAADTLQPFLTTTPYPSKVLVAVAARIGTTRLIDNTVLGEDSPRVGCL